MKWCTVQCWKIILIIMFVIGTVICFYFLLQPSEDNRKEKAIEYLKKKYLFDFEIGQKANIKDSNLIFTYEVFPVDNEKIIFTVKSGYTNSNIIPFLPALNRVYYADDFSDQIKAYIVAQNDASIKEIKVNNSLDVNKAVADIDTLMGAINDKLDYYNINTTDFSCGVELSILIGNKMQRIDFYKRDKGVIENLLNNKLINAY